MYATGCTGLPCGCCLGCPPLPVPRLRQLLRSTSKYSNAVRPPNSGNKRVMVMLCPSWFYRCEHTRSCFLQTLWRRERDPSQEWQGGRCRLALPVPLLVRSIRSITFSTPFPVPLVPSLPAKRALCQKNVKRMEPSRPIPR